MREVTPAPSRVRGWPVVVRRVRAALLTAGRFAQHRATSAADQRRVAIVIDGLRRVLADVDGLRPGER